jgi:acyl-coenzyme A synthetase/AMP-(fatty) acid ligase
MHGIQAASGAAYAALKSACTNDTPGFWGAIAATSLYWFNDVERAWLRQESGQWRGWASDGSPAQLEVNSAWTTWRTALDMPNGPHTARWFVGGLTNAAFNECDAPVLAGGGRETAFICEPASGPHTTISRRELLLRSVAAAHVLRGLLAGIAAPRIAIHLPNDEHAVVWIQAAKRLAVPYVAISGGTAPTSVTQRLDDVGASVLITCAALAQDATEAAAAAASPPLILSTDGPTAHPSAPAVQAAPVLLSKAQAAIEAVAIAAGIESLQTLADQDLVRLLWRLVPPKPVEASHPLFILYTSGSTGKPKGIVHAHAGFQVGLCATSSIALGLAPPAPSPDRQGPGEVLLVVATPGWITGQAYMISAALLTRTTSVLLDGSPISPPDRFAAIIARHRVSVLKAGSTFLRMLMTHAAAEEILARHDLSSLRLGTFCAEPVRCQRYPCCCLSDCGCCGS